MLTPSPNGARWPEPQPLANPGRFTQPSVRHRQRRFRHCTSANSPPQGRSRGRVNTQSLPDVDSDPHTGHLAASGSSVTSCTILTPTAMSTTRSTARPSSPNRHDASSLRSTTARGSPLAAPEHSEDQGAAGRPRSDAPHGPNLKLPGQDRRAGKADLVTALRSFDRPAVLDAIRSALGSSLTDRDIALIAGRKQELSRFDAL